MNDSLYTSRSVSGCLRIATSLTVGNLKHIIRKTWASALCAAVMLTMLILAFIPSKQINDAGMAHINVAFVLLCLSYIGTFVATIWVLASTVSLVNGEKIRRNFARSVVLSVVLYLYAFIMSGVSTGLATYGIGLGVKIFHLSATTATILSVIAVALILILLYVLSLPLDMASVKYILNRDTTLSQVVTRDYATAFRHWGALFLTSVVTFLISLVLMLILAAPLTIISLAHLQNTLGIINGDPDGAPSYFLALFIATSVVTCFILVYIEMWHILVMCYVCGSITTQEAERKKQTKIMKDDETTENTVY